MLSVIALPFLFEHVAHVVPFANPTFVFQFLFIFLVKQYLFIFVSQVAQSLTLRV